MTPAIVDEMWASGLMSAFNPVAAGGVEPSFAEMIETWIEMAWQDGSFGWMVSRTCRRRSPLRRICPTRVSPKCSPRIDNRVTMGGQFFPNGQGRPSTGGYRFSGSWSFGSGTGHSQYVAAGFLPMDNGEMRWISEGLPDMQVAVVPRADVTFTDGWYVQGLKGTGSYDGNAADLFVPQYRTFPLFARDPRRGIAGHPHGADARHRGRSRIVGARSRQEHARRCRGARRHEIPDERHGVAGQPPDLSERTGALRRRVAGRPSAGTRRLHTGGGGRCRGRGSHPDSARGYARCRRLRHRCGQGGAEWAHLVAGTSSIREGSRLERAFRDIYTGTQHAFISEKVAIDAAQIWLGIIEAISEGNTALQKYIAWSRRVVGPEAGAAIRQVASLDAYLDHDPLHVAFSGGCAATERLAEEMRRELGDDGQAPAHALPAAWTSRSWTCSTPRPRRAPASPRSPPSRDSRATRCSPSATTTTTLRCSTTRAPASSWATPNPLLRARGRFHLTATNDEDGVAVAIEKFVLENS